jgi:anti-sigma B factor antagonist
MKEKGRNLFHPHSLPHSPLPVLIPHPSLLPSPFSLNSLVWETITMEVNIKTIDQVTIAEVSGDVDGSTAAKLQEEILPLAVPNSKILMDMTQVPYMSSAGLRMLLSLYRKVGSVEGKLVLVGLSEEIRDTMSITGFLDFFTTCDTVDAGLATLE